MLSDSPPTFLLSRSAETFRRGTIVGFRKILVSKNVKNKRGGGYHDFLPKICCLSVRKTS